MINDELLHWARRYTGVAEIEGPANNPIIMEFARILGVTHYVRDEQEWCGLFLAVLAHVTGAEKPASYLIARNWLGVGMPVVPGNEMLGDVVVLWTGAPDSTGGHAGLYTGQSDTHVYLVGGNQINTVREFQYEKSRILGVRSLYRKTN